MRSALARYLPSRRPPKGSLTIDKSVPGFALPVFLGGPSIQRLISITISCLLGLQTFLSGPVLAEPMRFKRVSTGGNHCCWWISAEGEITDETPRNFERFLASEKWASGPIRLDSPGGFSFRGIRAWCSN